jgi:hypothetical protein
MKGLLFSQMEPRPEDEADFHDWYETEHIPVRMALPGFSEAVRYEATEGEPRYLACYFLDDLAVLDTPAYRRLKSDPSARTARLLGTVNGFTRYICTEISDTGSVDEQGGVLSVVAFSVPAADEDEFETWYAGEHVPLLMKVDGWLRVRRYRTQPGHDGPPWTHLALHELRDLSVMDSPDRAKARATAARDRLARHAWFGQSGRWLYRPIHRATSTVAAPRS